MSVQFVNRLPDNAQQLLKRKPSRWYAIVDELKDHMGQWAVVGVKDSQQQARTEASFIRTKQSPAMADGIFEAATSQASNGSWNVYARYMGEVTA